MSFSYIEEFILCSITEFSLLNRLSVFLTIYKYYCLYVCILICKKIAPMSLLLGGFKKMYNFFSEKCGLTLGRLLYLLVVALHK